MGGRTSLNFDLTKFRDDVVGIASPNLQEVRVRLILLILKDPLCSLDDGIFNESETCFISIFYA